MWTETLGDGRSAIHLEPEEVETYIKRGLEQDGVTDSSVEVGHCSVLTYPDTSLSGAIVDTKEVEPRGTT